MILIDDRSPVWAPCLGNQIEKTNVMLHKSIMGVVNGVVKVKKNADVNVQREQTCFSYFGFGSC